MNESSIVPRGRLWLFRAVAVLLVLVAVEGIVRLAASRGAVDIRVYPVTGRSDPIRFLGDLDPHFGSWHQPNADVVVSRLGQDVRYISNAQGMRDRPREFASAAPERVVVLGDSFVEGMGVGASNRFTDLLEARTGVEFLNFGTSGRFGPTQEWLLYRHLASRFEHSRVFIFLLPANDFEDNGAPDAASGRYRPFLRKTNGTYEVSYPFPFAEVQARREYLSPLRKLRHRLYNHWYTLNVLANLEMRNFLPRVPPSSYDNYSEDDLEKLLFAYGRIADLAAPRPVTVFVIPRGSDFVAQAHGQHRGRIVEALREFAAGREGLQVVDLMPAFLGAMKARGISPAPFFLDRDPHWAPAGHEVVAEAVLDAHPGIPRSAPRQRAAR